MAEQPLGALRSFARHGAHVVDAQALRQRLSKRAPCVPGIRIFISEFRVQAQGVELKFKDCGSGLPVSISGRRQNLELRAPWPSSRSPSVVELHGRSHIRGRKAEGPWTIMTFMAVAKHRRAEYWVSLLTSFNLVDMEDSHGLSDCDFFCFPLEIKG